MLNSIADSVPISEKPVLAPALQAGKRSNINTYDHGETWRENIRTEDNDYTTRPDGTRPDWFWTGPAPQEGKAGIINGRVTSLPLPNCATSTKDSIIDYFDNTWLITEIIFSGLQGVEAYYRPPYHNLRHPMMFYYGHPAALYINKLRVAGLLDTPVNEYFEHIFETGVDEMAWDDLSKNDMLWPMVKEVTEYRRKVYTTVRKVLEDSPKLGARALGWDDPEWAVFMGFEHERIHIETSTVLIRELPEELVREPVWVHEELSSRAPPENPMQSHEAATVIVGKPLDWPTYGWDNEYGRRDMHVPAFEASKYQVTNAQMLELVKAGGYRDESLWSTEGWKWRTFRNAKWPTFWVPHGPQGLHQYRLRLIWRTVDWAPAAPAVVNSHEARAFAAWRTRVEGLTGNPYRLLSEVEHHALRNNKPAHAPDSVKTAEALQAPAAMHATDPHAFSTGAELRQQKAANLQLAFGAEAPVDAFNGPQMFGNTWTWCEDWFSALPGGNGVHAFYDDFSSPCYDGEHSIIMGGSFMSTGDEASRFARFHFRPHFHQHASFHLARSDRMPPLTHIDSPPPHVGGWNPSSKAPASGPSAASAALTRTALMHYGAARNALVDTLPEVAKVVPEFPAAIAFLLEGALSKVGGKAGSVMDIGCGTGAVAFKMAESFNHVVAIDRDAEMLNVAQTLQRSGSSTITDIKVSGNNFTSVKITCPVSTDAASRVSFRQMDPCCIAPDIGRFDAVLLNDIVDKLISPKAPFGRMGGVSPIVKPGGIVVVVSGFDWDETVTDQRLWLGSTTTTSTSSHGNGHANGNGTNGSSNGNGHSNGNGFINGHSNGNGHTNGNGRTNGNGHANGNGKSNGPSKVSTGALMAPSARDSIQAALGSEFEFVSAQNVPCLMFEHSRKFTLKVMHALVWKHAGGACN